MSPLRTYLYRGVESSLAAQFPLASIDRNVFQISVPRAFPGGDLCTPIAHRLRAAIALPAQEIARQILVSFPWDEQFVEKPAIPEQTVVQGFINFRLSDAFLKKALCDCCRGGEKLPLKIFGRLLSEAVHKAGHAVDSIPTRGISTEDLQVARFDLLALPEESALIREIAKARALRRMIFREKFATDFLRFYGRIPLVTADKRLSIARYALVKASLAMMLQYGCG